jgi:hypothetical protein
VKRLPLIFLIGALLTFSLPVNAQTRLAPGDPPRAALITVSGPDEAGLITLEGGTGSVFPGAFVTIRNLYTGELAFTQAGLTGTFRVRMAGVDGNPFSLSPAEVQRTTETAGSLPGGPAVIVYAPVTVTAPDFVTAGTIAQTTWIARGTADPLQTALNVPWQTDFTLELDEALLDSPPGTTLCTRLALDAAFTLRDGALLAQTSPDAQNGWSARQTAVGVGIVGAAPSLVSDADCVSLAELNTPDLPDDGPRVEWSASLDLADLDAGLYVPTLHLTLIDVTGSTTEASHTRLPLVVRAGLSDETAVLPMALLWDTPSDGSRGVLPNDSPYALANRVRFDSADYVLPPGSYPLEPYVLNLLPNRYRAFAAPLIPLELPGGRLEVTITRPDGTRASETLAVAQNRLGTAALDDGALFGRQSPVDTLRLTTGAAALDAYAFDAYGEYRIVLNVDVADRFGNRYNGGGSFRVLIAEPLDLTPTLPSGMPLQAGADVILGAHVAPGVPAEVRVDLVQVGVDGRRTTATRQGMAGHGGLFIDESLYTIASSPGEYALTLRARYTDVQGRLWAGCLTSAGVIVAADSTLIGHGARGVLNADAASPPPAWFEIRGDGPRIVNSPFHNGDLALIGPSTADGFAPRLSLQDVDGAYGRWLLESGVDPALVYRQTMPVVGARSYAYLSAVTPGVTIRQFALAGQSDDLPLFADSDDPLNQQIGAGHAGLQPGDIVFHYGGAVLIDPQTGLAETAGYAATGAIIPTLQAGASDRDGSGPRVLPAGHNDAVFTVGGEPTRLFVVLTALGPGEQIAIGTAAAFSGQVGPALPADIDLTLTAPDGAVHSWQVQANPFGFFTLMPADFTFEQPGRWQARLVARYDGLVSSGALENPITGGLPGAADGTFSLFVLPGDVEPLPWNPALADSTIPAALAYNFNFTAPADWTDVRAYRVLTMPGTVLIDEEVRLIGRSFEVQYNPGELNRSFPNVEVEGRLDGPSVSDAKRLTLVLTGIDANGQPRMQIGDFTIFHDRLINLPAS